MTYPIIRAIAVPQLPEPTIATFNRLPLYEYDVDDIDVIAFVDTAAAIRETHSERGRKEVR